MASVGRYSIAAVRFTPALLSSLCFWLSLASSTNLCYLFVPLDIVFSVSTLGWEYITMASKQEVLLSAHPIFTIEKGDVLYNSIS